MTPNPKDLVGAKKAPLRYVPPALAIEASGPMEDGAIKYGPFNWREYPVEVVTYVEATLRHLYAFLDGQDNAEDSGHSHIGHAIAGLGIIADAKANGTLIDNRYAKGPAAKMLAERDKSAPVLGPNTRDGTAEWPQPEDPYPLGPGHTTEPWGTGDGTVYGMPLGEWNGPAANTGGPKCACPLPLYGHMPHCAFLEVRTV